MARINPGIESCVLCVIRKPETWEHILPESLGGRLQSRILCSPCNHDVSAPLVAQLTRDPSIILAVLNLKGELPRLHQAFTKNVSYAAPGPDGAPIFVRADKLRARRTSEGTYLIDSRRAARHLAKLLRKRGLPEKHIQAKITEFDLLEDGKPLEMGAGLQVRRSTITELSPSLRDGFVDERFAVMVALEFLSLQLPDAVQTPNFDSLRAYVAGGDPPATVEVERLTTKTYAPFHGLRWERHDDMLEFFIHLFGWLVFRVRFLKIQVRGRMAAYYEELNTANSYLSQDGRDGMFQLLNP